jgi:hypothetical protein
VAAVGIGGEEPGQRLGQLPVGLGDVAGLVPRRNRRVVTGPEGDLGHREARLLAVGVHERRLESQPFGRSWEGSDAHRP